MDEQFDIFFSHNSKDKPAIRQLKQHLVERAVNVWLDEDELQPGINWIPLLDEAIKVCRSAGAFVSSQGIGQWEDAEIQALLIRAVREKIPVIPVLLPGDYEPPELPYFLQSRTYVDMRAGFSDELIDRLIWGATGQKPGKKKATQNAIYIDRLPTVEGGFFGRAEELKLLDDALAGAGTDGATRVIQFIAAGGTGKTKLLRHWLNLHTADIGNLIVWSFYSQGAAEDKQVSASPFFSEALNAFGVDPGGFKTEEERADALAQRLIDSRTLLVLDGLEPLQHVGRGMDGRLKDRAVARLLQTLAARHSRLCVVTTRIRVHDISDRPQVVSQELDNLQIPDGVALLRSLEVKGPGRELASAVREYGGHALALHLLGNALTTYLDGDIHKRDTLDELLDEYGDAGRHAFKVMQAYQLWLQGTPELQLLYLLGLFDHPIETEVLDVLWQAQIPDLTADIPRNAWQNAIRNLREKHRLLSNHEGRPDLLDCHPLLREWFGGQLQARQPEAWRQAHARLYEHYKALPEKEQPDTLAEMHPLFSAVAHGCAVGLHQQALDEVYWLRIKRGREHYLTRKLGAFSDDLATLAHFFITPWQTPSAGFTDAEQAVVLSWAGFRLRALGRLREAVEPLQAAVDQFSKLENWQQAAANAGNLSELQLTLGDLVAAVANAALSVAYADQSGDLFQLLSKRTTHADALHQAGQAAQALELFRAAEALQQERQPDYPRLYSLQGYQYCDLLLAQAGDDVRQIAAVLARAVETLEWVTPQNWLLDIALDQLILGRAHLQQGNVRHSADWMEQAVAGLRAAGVQEFLVRGLLARAALLRHTHDYAGAHQDLQEVFDLAEPSGMRLHLTDYHLEMARLTLAEDHADEAREHTELADQLIAATGYHRRLPELAALRIQLDET